MSDAAQETARYVIHAYHETPENAALRGEQTPPPEPVTIARQQLALAVREHGEVIDLDSIREDARIAVVVDEDGEWVPAEAGVMPTGHIVTWSCTAHARVGTDADDPVLDPVETDEETGQRAFRVPTPWSHVGGAVRLRHNVGGPVTTLAYAADGSGIGYLLATDLDDKVQHVEFFGGTAFFVVEAD